MTVASASVVASTHSAIGSVCSERQRRVANRTRPVASLPARKPAPMNAALTGGLIAQA